ncbi:hypothetical protein ABZX36_13630 [Nocardia sp. NPDC003239]|uniref:hypothetical protein n=1 Tax=Nocardia sp. NPDC003239 TaxID=3154445 RepID=UPI0033BF2814
MPELSRFGIDVNLDRAEEVDVGAVRGRDDGQDLVVDALPGAAYCSVVSPLLPGGPGDRGVGGTSPTS